MIPLKNRYHSNLISVPIPIIYYGLDYWDVGFAIPSDFIEEGNQKVNKLLKAFRMPPVEEGSKAMLHLVSAYFITKMMMPLRIGASLWMTPFFARRITWITDRIPRRTWIYYYEIGTSGNLSIAYFLDWILMIGTPGIFRILLFKSLSQVATR